MSFTEAVEVYQVAVRAVATRETIDAPLARRFAGEVRRLSRAMNDFNDDELWKAVIRRARRTLRELASTPLAPADPVFDLGSCVEHLASLVGQARNNYPSTLVARGDLCVAALAELSHDNTNRFGDLIVEVLLIGDVSMSGLLVQTPHLDAVRRWLLKSASGVRLLTAGEAARLSALESLVVAGPSYWFPPYILSAPRAESICFIHYAFLRDQESHTRMFTGSNGSIGTAIRSRSPMSLPTEDEIEVGLLVPTIDWETLARVSGGHRSSNDDDIEEVPANLFLLADGYSVYLEASDGPTIDVVDLEAEARPRLRSEQTRAVGPGDFIVLRSEGGTGDYIPTIADSLLGNRAVLLRAMQRRWKTALRSMIREQGFSRVDRDLRDLGVSSPNLRYRLWRNSLRSRDPKDFRVLLEYIGLGDEAGGIWSAMGEIFEAHVRAGQDVRKLLEEAVIATDPERLIQTGRVDVRLSEMEAGTLSVLRVEGRAPETVMVDEDNLRVMMKVEPDLWQG